jgi:hypothetical protein
MAKTNRSADPADHQGQHGPVARPDFAKLHIALIRRERFGMDVTLPEVDGPVALFDDDGQAVDDAIARHPARPDNNIDTGDVL